VTALARKIVELRTQGYTYNKIAEALNCSKATISYHLSPGGKKRAKDKINARLDADPNMKHVKRVWTFKHPRTPTKKQQPWYQHKSPAQKRKSITQKAHQFQQSMTFNFKDVHSKYGDHFPCALTGRPLDWDNPEDYQYDHIVPVASGGDNTLANLQILCTEANQAKGHLTDEEFIDLCKEVVQNQGYKLYKPLEKTTNGS